MSAAPALKPTIYRTLRHEGTAADQPFEPPAEWGIRMELREPAPEAGARRTRRPSLV